MLKIFTLSHKRPDFIGLQMQSFRKYLDEPFEFIVFNNASFNKRFYDPENENHDEIDRQCELWGATAIDILRDEGIESWCQAQEITGPIFDARGQYSNANVACAYPICWAWEKYISKVNGPICLTDSDVFLVQPVRLTDPLKDHEFCFIPQYRVGAAEYMWNAFFLADLSRVPQPETLNWWCGRVNDVPVDVGGQTHRYLADHPELRLFRIQAPYISDDPRTNFHPTDYEQLFFGEQFFGIHYRSGSNWNNRPAVYHEKKTKWLLYKLNLKG